MENTIASKFDNLVKELTKTKYGFTVKLQSDEIVVEAGSGYPDKIVNEVFHAAEKVGLKNNEISLCAGSHGMEILKSVQVNGGKKMSWW